MSVTHNVTRVYVRWSIRRDLLEICDIERRSDAHPWAEDDFLRATRRRDTICMVAEHGTRVVGYMVYALRAGRIDLLRLAVHPDFRRSGVGSQMVAKLVGKLSAGRRETIAVDVPETHMDAFRFLRSRDFWATGVTRAGHAATGEDLYRFEYTLPDPWRVTA